MNQWIEVEVEVTTTYHLDEPADEETLAAIHQHMVDQMIEGVVDEEENVIVEQALQNFVDENAQLLRDPLYIVNNQGHFYTAGR